MKGEMQKNAEGGVECADVVDGGDGVSTNFWEWVA